MLTCLRSEDYSTIGGSVKVFLSLRTTMYTETSAESTTVAINLSRALARLGLDQYEECLKQNGFEG
jgi:hypothetical protein